MSNMSYCRFQNTLNDLRDCMEFMDDELSHDEHVARIALFRKCVAIADGFDECDFVEIKESESA